MPELPEVEVTRRGIEPAILSRTVTAVVLRRANLRAPLPLELVDILPGERLLAVERRGKYLLLNFSSGTLIIHLGMSGHLRIFEADTPALKHDHFDLVFGKIILRLNDPRRFGVVLWHAANQGSLANHPSLASLGVEPLSEHFTSDAFFHATRRRKIAIKNLLLSGRVVVGVGNIYACESLFMAGIHPATLAGKLSRARLAKLVNSIRTVLEVAITQGGSSLRDFLGADGNHGYFQQNYFVYGRQGLVCRECTNYIKVILQGTRRTFYCAHCQK